MRGVPVGTALGGGTVATHPGHHIAIVFLVTAPAAEKPVSVDDATMIATSFPEFIARKTGRRAKLDVAGIKV